MSIADTAVVRVERSEEGLSFSRDDLVAVEEPMELRVVSVTDGRRRAHSVAVTMRTPGSDEELAAGFLLSEGIIREPGDVERISTELEIDVELPLLRLRNDQTPEQEANTIHVYLRAGVEFAPELLNRNFYTSSSCGVCGKASLEALRSLACPLVHGEGPRVHAETVHVLGPRLREAQPVFDQTGGLHAAALFSPEGELLALREDVGRHNALDKLVGHGFLVGELPLADRVLLLSGRASWELMQKALVAGIPLVVAVGAPSSLAVELAREFGITLVGFAKGESFNIYAGAQRIVFGGRAGRG